MAQLVDGDPAQVGSYTLVARLGPGAAGPLFRGVPAGPGGPDGRPVAVRILRERLAADDELRGRLAREVTAARGITGPNLAPLVDAGLREPRPWVAWDYLPGPSLAAVMSWREALPMSQVAALATGLAGALHALHDAGVIHGDLHPGNVFVSDGVPRLTGFGTSSAVAAELAGVRPSPAARDFLAPQQAAGHPATMPGDVFALAAVLVRATGEAGPFGIGGQGAAWVNLGGIPPEIRPLVARCLNVNPAMRPTAAEFRAVAIAAFPDAGPLAWPAEEPAPDPVPVPPVPAAPAPAAPPAAAAPRPQPVPGHGMTRRQKTTAVVACAIVVGLVLVIGLAGTPNGTPKPTSGGVDLLLDDYQAGDCLYGPSSIDSGGEWPYLAWQVPCGQQHTYEVFYVNEAYWSQDEAFPGTPAVEKQGQAECESQFQAYIGGPQTASAYVFTYVAPLGSDQWNYGQWDYSRSLDCIAYLPTAGNPNGGMVTGSIKGSA